jgi:hypothetical protein
MSTINLKAYFNNLKNQSALIAAFNEFNNNNDILYLYDINKIIPIINNNNETEINILS